MRVLMEPHNSDWIWQYQQEAARIVTAAGPNAVAVHHVGSTAIPGIYAKPVLDLLLVVQSADALDEKQSEIEALGYEARGEYGIPGRRFYRRGNSQGDRTHQIHAFGVGSPQIARHLAFRDYMIAHPEIAQEYSNLKRQLAANHPNDIEAYMDGKDEFIQEIDRRAAHLSSG